MKPITPEQREKLAGRLVIASVSGGKDSAALSLWLTENGIEHRRVFADTGWEHGATYEYLRGELTRVLGPIDEVQGKHGGMVGLIRSKQSFPSRLRRFCTEELKVRPLAAYVRAAQDEVGECVSAVGIRAAESKARAKLPEWEWSETFDSEVWRPLIGWTEQDVIDMHTRHGLRPNPLYLMGAERVGCWPCIFSRKSEIKLLAELDPERVLEIERLEAEMTAGRAALHPQRDPALNRRSWFQSNSVDPVTGRQEPMAIRDVVLWSGTSRGGRQLVLLDDAPEGCVRWGLCEHSAKEDT